MIIVMGNILDIEEGVIIHQVNCCKRIGAGVSGAIIKKYPQVAKAYYDSFRHLTPDEIYGMCFTVPVTPTLEIVNSYSQKGYGNTAKTGLVYTNLDYLAHNIRQTVYAFQGKQVFIPYGIGCGLGGETWERVEERIKDLDITVVKLS